MVKVVNLDLNQSLEEITTISIAIKKDSMWKIIQTVKEKRENF